jgi:outer membrane protein assembly factor BamB
MWMTGAASGLFRRTDRGWFHMPGQPEEQVFYPTQMVRDAISGDSELLVGADASDRINAWRTPTGETAWTSESLMFRGLGPPGTVAQSVVFGDSSGTLHWFSRAKGESQARVTTDGSAITTPPVNVGGMLVVVTRGGGVFAFRPA